jgi:hypothetical protein
MTVGIDILLMLLSNKIVLIITMVINILFGIFLLIEYINNNFREEYIIFIGIIIFLLVIDVYLISRIKKGKEDKYYLYNKCDK